MPKEKPQPSKERAALNNLNAQWRRHQRMFNYDKLTAAFCQFVQATGSHDIHLEKAIDANGTVSGFTCPEIAANEPEPLGYDAFMRSHTRRDWPDAAKDFFWRQVSILSWETVEEVKCGTLENLPRMYWMAIASSAQIDTLINYVEVN